MIFEKNIHWYTCKYLDRLYIICKYILLFHW